jgi:multidrug efflux pump subunit AcrB
MCQESTVRTDLVSKNQFIISLSSDTYSAEELVSYGETIKEQLEDVDYVSSVTIEGESTKQVVVEADIQKLQSYNISIEDILSLMQAQNLNIPAGSISYDTGSITVASDGLFTSLSDIENTVIGGADDSLSFVKLKDVANVYVENTSDKYYEQDGRPCILLVGKFEDDVNAVNVGKNVRAVIDELKETLPEKLIFHEVMYAPEAISENINGFLLNLLESILLIMLVVMIGVGIRNALVISTALPISILVTFTVMYLLNIEFQFISIAALIVSLGILVDNAVVISEAIQQGLNAGKEKTDAIVDGVRETWVPVLTSTLTTIVTFSIIYFLPGVVGQVAGTIPTVVIASLISSYLMAMCGIPVLAYFFFKPEKEKPNKKPNPVHRFFDGLLGIGLRYPKRTLLVAFATLGVAAFLVTQLGMQFFPASSKPVIYIDVKNETLNLDSTGEIIDEVQEILDEDDLVAHYTSSIGGGMPSFFLSVPSMSDADNAGRIMIELDEEELKKVGDTEDAAKEIQAKVNEAIPGATIEVKCLEYSMPADDKIVYTVSGDDINEINALAQEMVEGLQQIEGTDNVRDTAVISQYEYKVNLDSELLSSYGLLKYDVIKQLNTSLMGATASTYTGSEDEMDIVVRTNVNSLEELENLPISGTVSDTHVLLGQVADITLEPTVPLINHYNGKRYVKVLSGVKSGYVSGTIESQFEKEYLSQLDTDGFTIVEQGEMSNMLSLIINLVKAAAVAIVIIYIILLLQFKDFAKPLNVLTSIPLSLIGCCFGLWILNMDIQAMALLGVVSLFGIVVNNGILLIEVIDAQRELGQSVEEACRSAVALRFRPIMISSVTTCIGLIPLIISKDPMSAPMAVTLMFGLAFSTVLTMVVVPTIYYLRESRRQKTLAEK